MPRPNEHPSLETKRQRRSPFSFWSIHRFGREHAEAEDRFAETRNHAVLVHRLEPVPHDAGDLEAHRVRTDIHGGKNAYRQVSDLAT